MAKTDETAAQAKQTTVEEGTEFRGTLHSTCQVVVRGMVDGELSAPTVIVSETGTVVGNVKAKSIRSEGVLAGRVDAQDVYLSGSVRSDTVIRAKTLEVKLQRRNEKLEVTFGECTLDVGDDPAAEKPEAAPARTQTLTKMPTLQPAPHAAEATESKPAENARRNGAADDEGSTDRPRSVPPRPS